MTTKKTKGPKWYTEKRGSTGSATPQQRNAKIPLSGRALKGARELLVAAQERVQQLTGELAAFKRQEAEQMAIDGKYAQQDLELMKLRRAFEDALGKNIELEKKLAVCRPVEEVDTVLARMSTSLEQLDHQHRSLMERRDVLIDALGVVLRSGKEDAEARVDR
jgi:hypothetical protein